MSVRLAGPSDENAVFDLLSDLHAENAMAPKDDAKVRGWIRKATEGQGGIIGVIDGDDGLVGSIGMFMDQWWYGDDWFLLERWNFVAEPYRHTDYAVELIEFGKHCADRLGIPLHIGIVSRHRPEAKTRLYRRHLTMVGGYFMHEARGS